MPLRIERKGDFIDQKEAGHYISLGSLATVNPSTWGQEVVECLLRLLLWQWADSAAGLVLLENQTLITHGVMMLLDACGNITPGSVFQRALDDWPPSYGKEGRTLGRRKLASDVCTDYSSLPHCNIKNNSISTNYFLTLVSRL